MGQLIAIPDFKWKNPRGDEVRPLLDAYWYFSNAIDHFSIPDDITMCFPHCLYIHDDIIIGQKHHINNYGHSVQRAGEFRVEMRTYIDEYLRGIVIYDRVNKDYYRSCTGSDASSSFQIKHGYYKFLFENADDATLFKIKFADVARVEMSNRHPDYPKQSGYVDVRQAYHARAITHGHLKDFAELEI